MGGDEKGKRCPVVQTPTLQSSKRFRLMMILCGNSQSVEEDEEHHQPVKALRLHIHQTFHPEKTIPTTGQAAKHRKKAAHCGAFFELVYNIPALPVMHTLLLSLKDINDFKFFCSNSVLLLLLK